MRLALLLAFIIPITAIAQAPKPPSSSASAGPIGAAISSPTATTYAVSVGSVALAASTTYVMNVVCP